MGTETYGKKVAYWCEFGDFLKKINPPNGSQDI